MIGEQRDADGSEVAELVRRAAIGDMLAWERLVEQYGRLIWSVTRTSASRRATPRMWFR